MKKKIAILVGSLRKESFNRKIAKVLMQLSPPSLDMQIIEIGQLSFYNQDNDANPPETWTTFRQQINECDGVLFVTPEYNRSVPGVLKNALDIGSRPYGKSVWNGKPGAIVSVSPGAMGGFGANHHLRQSLVFVNVPCMQQPEAYIGEVAKLLDEQGNLTNEGTQKFLSQFMEAFAHWVETNAITS
ncbi:MAG: NADPH-dependent FMN reductase [Gammaproteobacteria bacterium]